MDNSRDRVRDRFNARAEFEPECLQDPRVFDMQRDIQYLLEQLGDLIDR